MPQIVELSDAQAAFSELVERAAAGEEIIVAVNGVPRAQLVPIAKEQPLRQPGALKGQIWAADDFDDPLPPEILRGFYGEDEETS